ncbi:BrnT family toxin [Sphingomonas sp. NCPPB 2930]
MYNNGIEIAFDDAKDKANIAKHGISLAMARAIDWGDVLCAPDTRRDYRELREIGFAPVARRLYIVVFVQRSNTMRIISLRKANAREVKLYDDALQEPTAGDTDGG